MTSAPRNRRYISGTGQVRWSRRFVFEHRENGAGRYCLSHADAELAHSTSVRCRDRVLHFHRLNNHQSVAGLYDLAYFDRNANDDPRHWRCE